MISVVITAAGSGSRTNQDKNKLLINRNETTVLHKTVAAFAQRKDVDYIIIAAKTAEFNEIKTITEEFGDKIKIISGGETRTESVRNGLNCIGTYCKKTETVLIHDGARPYISQDLIGRCIDDVKKYGSSIAAIPVTDTVYMNNCLLNRDRLYAIQTPQGFNFKEIKKAYDLIEKNEIFTDDSQIYKKYIAVPRFTAGEISNKKITFENDLNEFFGTAKNYKCGIGYDSHKFTENRDFILGGIKIYYHLGLEGQSDADALTHAIIDSLLTSAGLADIGSQFPDSDKKYKNISSLKLLKNTINLIEKKSLKVENIAAVIICEEPKLNKYFPKMKEKLSDILKCGIENIGLSAKTNEGMGYIGNGEGIAVFVNCLLSGIE